MVVIVDSWWMLLKRVGPQKNHYTLSCKNLQVRVLFYFQHAAEKRTHWMVNLGTIFGYLWSHAKMIFIVECKTELYIAALDMIENHHRNPITKCKSGGLDGFEIL